MPAKGRSTTLLCRAVALRPVQRLTARGVGLLLGLLTAAALVLNTAQWASTGHLSPMMLLPTLGLAAMLVAFPFLVGWNPLADKVARNMRSCAACGTMWSPELDGARFCPACGGKSLARAPL